MATPDELLSASLPWPPNRYLELAPRYWAQSRARLDERQLDLAVGHLTIPPPAEQQSPPR